MKKENRKHAQEKRAEQRQKQQQQEQIKKYTLIGLPIVLALILLYLIIANPFPATHDGHDHEVTSSENVTPQTENETSTALQTDASLTVEDGDTVNIDYVGSIDGVEFEGGNTQGYGADLIIGSHSYIDDFEEQLIGAHPGDVVDVVVTFPENYGAAELDGKEAVFVTTVNGIYR